MFQHNSSSSNSDSDDMNSPAFKDIDSDVASDEEEVKISDKDSSEGEEMLPMRENAKLRKSVSEV